MVPTTVINREWATESPPEDERVLNRRERGRKNQRAFRDRKRAHQMDLENQWAEKIDKKDNEIKRLKFESRCNRDTNAANGMAVEVVVQKRTSYGDDGASCSSTLTVPELQDDKAIAKDEVKKWAFGVFEAITDLLKGGNESLVEFLNNMENRQKCVLMLKCMLCRSFKCGIFKGFAIKTLPKIIEFALRKALNQPVPNRSQLQSELEQCFVEGSGCAKGECQRAKEELAKCKEELRKRNDLVEILLPLFVENNSAGELAFPVLTAEEMELFWTNLGSS